MKFIPKSVIAKAETMTDNVALEHQRRYIEDVMEMDKCDYETAWAKCLGQTDPPEYGHMLAFKMHPILCYALYNQRSKSARRQAAENFAKTLCEEERKLFYAFFFNPETAARYKEEKKKAEKDAKKQKRGRK